MPFLRFVLKEFSKRREDVFPTVSPDRNGSKHRLSFLDLCSIGVGSTLGLGVYILAEYVAKEKAGPSVVLSLLIAGVCSTLAGVCTCEVISKFPYSCTPYAITYKTLGELCAFTVGWNLLLEYAIASALAAKACGHYLDNMTNNTIHTYLADTVSWFNIYGIERHPDFLGFSLFLFIALVSFLSTKVSCVITIILTLISLLLVSAIICVGFFHVDNKNWTEEPGFFAFGLRGIMSGASSWCTFFINLPTVTFALDSAKEPAKGTSSLICVVKLLNFISLFGVSVALTLSCPWQKLELKSGLSRAYEERGIFGSDYVIGIAAVVGLLAVVLGLVLPLSKLCYGTLCEMCLSSPSEDNSDISWQRCISRTTALVLASAIILTFEIELLLDILSLGTLLSFAVMGVCVICVRYDPDLDEQVDIFDSALTRSTEFYDTKDKQMTKSFSGLFPITQQNNEAETQVRKAATEVTWSNNHERTSLIHQSASVNSFSNKSLGQRYGEDVSSSQFSLEKSVNDLFGANEDSWKRVSFYTLVYLSVSVILCIILTALGSKIVQWWAVTVIVLLVVIMIICTFCIGQQPRNSSKGMRSIPFIPLTSIFFSVLLLSFLSVRVWIRFAVWTLIGLTVYFTCKIHKYCKHNRDDQEVVLYDIRHNVNKDDS